MANGEKDVKRRGRKLFAALRRQETVPPESADSDNLEGAPEVDAPSPEPDATLEPPSRPTEPTPSPVAAPPEPTPSPVAVSSADATPNPRGNEPMTAERGEASAATPPPEPAARRPRELPDPPAGLPEPDGSPIELPLVVAIANQKGGVGKTTTSVNLGAALAEEGFRVLVVDLDPQGNATTGLGINHRDIERSIYDVMMNDTPMEDCVEASSLKNLFVVPATIDLAGAEIELVPAFSREMKLRRAVERIRDDYDFTIIDCPPSLGLLTVNGLAAADDVIVPIQCEYYALEGLGQLLRNVALVRSNLNPALDVRGIVLTMYDARTKLADQVEQEVRNHFGSRVYRTVVPRSVRLSEAPSFGQPIIVFDPTSRGAGAYRELAKEVSRGATRRSG